MEGGDDLSEIDMQRSQGQFSMGHGPPRHQNKNNFMNTSGKEQLDIKR